MLNIIYMLRVRLLTKNVQNPRSGSYTCCRILFINKLPCQKFKSDLLNRCFAFLKIMDLLILDGFRTLYVLFPRIYKYDVLIWLFFACRDARPRCNLEARKISPRIHARPQNIACKTFIGTGTSHIIVGD